MDEVEPREVLGTHLNPPLSDLHPEGVEKLMADCVKKIREAHLKAKSKQLSAHLKGESGDEAVKKLEQIMNIHKRRHSLHRD